MVFQLPAKKLPSGEYSFSANVSVGDGKTYPVAKNGTVQLPANLPIPMVKHILTMNWLPKDDEAANASAMAGLDKLAQDALKAKAQQSQADAAHEAGDRDKAAAGSK